jgi:hypothetical protein
MANFQFNANEVPEDTRSFDPLPAGDYTMQVIDSEIKDTKSGTGQQLVLTLEVIDGPYANRRVWDRLNIVNQNPDAQRISERALADLCLAVGLAKITDSEMLHFKPFTGRVSISVDKSGQYGPQNRVRYKSRGGASPAPRPGPAANGSKPWTRPAA